MSLEHTAELRGVLTRAHQIARGAPGGTLTPEILLHVLVSQPEGLAARALAALSVPLDELRGAVEVPTGEVPVPVGETAFSPDADRIRRRAAEIAREHQDRVLNTGHLLLAFLDAAPDGAVDLLHHYDVHRRRVQEVLHALPDCGGESWSAGPRPRVIEMALLLMFLQVFCPSCCVPLLVGPLGSTSSPYSIAAWLGIGSFL